MANDAQNTISFTDPAVEITAGFSSPRSISIINSGASAIKFSFSPGATLIALPTITAGVVPDGGYTTLQPGQAFDPAPGFFRKTVYLSGPNGAQAQIVGLV